MSDKTNAVSGATPGPWRVVDRGAVEPGQYRFLIMGKPDIHPSIGTPPNTVGECVTPEDAALVASAPAMRAALRECADICRGPAATRAELAHAVESIVHAALARAQER